VQIEVAISHSISECQSDKCRGLGNFATNLVAMATSFDKSEKMVQIDNIHRNTFHLLKKIMKIGPVYPQIALLNLKKNKKEMKASKIYSPSDNFASRLINWHNSEETVTDWLCC